MFSAIYASTASAFDAPMTVIRGLIHERPPLPDDEPRFKETGAQVPIVSGIESTTVGVTADEGLSTKTVAFWTVGQRFILLQVDRGHADRITAVVANLIGWVGFKQPSRPGNDATTTRLLLHRHDDVAAHTN